MNQITILVFTVVSYRVRLFLLLPMQLGMPLTVRTNVVLRDLALIAPSAHIDANNEDSRNSHAIYRSVCRSRANSIDRMITESTIETEALAHSFLAVTGDNV